MTKPRRSVPPRGSRLAERVRKAVDGGVERAEKIHKKVASFPLELMEQLEFFPHTAKDLHEIQDRSIGAAYDIVRDINRDVIRVAKQALKRQRARVKARPARKEAKKSASTATKHEAA